MYLYLLRYERDRVIALPANIYELIDLELFSYMSERLQQFLLALCPFKDFTYEQAEFVWSRQGGEDTPELLKRLRNKNTFVIYGEYTHRFYIHSIFRQFLEKRVERQTDEGKNIIYTKCGDYAASLEFYRKTQDHALVMEILRKDRGCPSVMMMFYSRPGELDEELERVEKNIPVYSRITDGQGVGGGELMRMRCAFVSGNEDQIEQLKAEIIEPIKTKQQRNRMLWRTAELGQGLIGAMTGMYAYVPVWMKSREEMRQHVYMFSYPIHMIIYGSCLMEDKEYSKIMVRQDI